MTPAERQQRRRKRLAKEKASAASKAKVSRARQKAQAAYIPTPPGIVYWTAVKVQTEAGEREIWAPQAKPAVMVERGDLDDADLLAAWRRLTRWAVGRGLLKLGEALDLGPASPKPDAGADLLQARETRELGPGECCTIGPRPG